MRYPSCPTVDHDLTTDQLSYALAKWQARQGLPHSCALEQLHRDDLTRHQRAWLTGFVAIWMDAERREDGEAMVYGYDGWHARRGDGEPEFVAWYLDFVGRPGVAEVCDLRMLEGLGWTYVGGGASPEMTLWRV